MRLSTICQRAMPFPEVTEEQHHDSVALQNKGKIFATAQDSETAPRAPCARSAG